MSDSVLLRPQVPLEETPSSGGSSSGDSSTNDATKHAMDPQVLDQFAQAPLKRSNADDVQRWGNLAYHHPSSGHNEYHLSSPLRTFANESGDSSLYSTTIFPQETQLDASRTGESGDTTSPSRPTRIFAKGPGSLNPLSSTIPSADTAANASDRSERARNAANQRHSRGKEPVLGGNPDSRQIIEREKNRLAATKCRKKKRAMNDELDSEYRAAASANTRMKREQRELRDQLTYWRMLALQHVNGRNGCQCAAIQRYNLDQAYKAVYDMDGSMHENVSSRLDARQENQERVLASAG